MRHATTSALAGFPGNPTTGVPSHIASTVGLPGLIAIPCTSTPGAPSRATTCAVRSRTDTEEPADSTTASASSSAARSARSSSAASSPTIPHGTATPPACATTAATVVPFTSRTWAGPGAAPAGDDLVAGRENRDARPRPHRDADDPERRQPAQLGRAQPPPGRDRHLPGPHVLADGQHVLTGRRRVEHLHLRLRRAWRRAVEVGVLDHHHRIGAGRDHRAGVRAHRLAGAHGDRRNHAGRHVVDQQQIGRRLFRRAQRVGGTDRVAVHRRAGEGRQRLARDQVLRKHAAERRLERNDFRPFDTGTSAAKDRERVAGRQHGEQLVHTRRATATKRITNLFPRSHRGARRFSRYRTLRSRSTNICPASAWAASGRSTATRAPLSCTSTRWPGARGSLGAGGQLVVETGKHTGRSPNDKFFVREPGSETHIDWTVNKDIDAAAFDALLARTGAYLNGKDVFALDCYVGADPRYRLPVRIVTEYAWQSLFARDLFIDTADGDESFSPEFTVIDAALFNADPPRDKTNSSTFIMVNFARKIILIGGTRYAGEIKKSVFTVMNYLMPLRDVLSMHCSANVGQDGAVAIFFGLSGTGKTTLSADANRPLIGDDEHGWSADGVFNLEGGCYAKAIKLSKEAEPEIWEASHRFGTVLENVVIDPQTRRARPRLRQAHREHARRVPGRLPAELRQERDGRSPEDDHHAHGRRVRRAAADREADARAGDVPFPFRLHGESRRHRARGYGADRDVLDVLRRTVHGAPSHGVRELARRAHRARTRRAAGSSTRVGPAAATASASA